jgi:enhanced filamentous growth protein 1
VRKPVGKFLIHLLTSARIPFERALDFANKEKITEQLYPLFVHDIGALLYHPSNQPRPGVTNSLVADRRRDARGYLPGPQTTQAPPLHHHHSMSNPIGAASQPPHSIAPHPASGRPGLDRAHTFPTPPTSASSIMGMDNSQSSYNWGNQGGVSGMHGNQPMTGDTGLNSRSVPNTPASTPPANSITGLQYQTSQGYDAARSYTAPSMQQSQYGSNQMRFGGPLPSNNFQKTDMAPPPKTEGATDVKPNHDGLPNDQATHGAEEEAEHEHDTEYTHTSASYKPAPYGYNPNTAAGALQGEVSHEDMSGSPHQNGSGRGTPRTTTQPQWQTGYSTPGRPQQASSNLYNVMEPQGTNGANGAYFPSQYTSGNLPPSNKRVRELDDDEADDGLKRQKTGHEGVEGGPVNAPTYNINRARAQPISQRRR